MSYATIQRSRTTGARVIAWAIFVLLHVLTVVELLVIANAMLNKSPIPGGLAFFGLALGTILCNLWYYFTIEARGLRYSPLGPCVPRPIPVGAWRGEIVDWDGGRVGRLRGTARWIISPAGILLTFGLVTVFVPWHEVLSIRPTDQSGMWAIEHRADDVRAPLLCGAGVVDSIIRSRGALPTNGMPDV